MNANLYVEMLAETCEKCEYYDKQRDICKACFCNDELCEKQENWLSRKNSLTKATNYDIMNTSNEKKEVMRMTNTTEKMTNVKALAYVIENCELPTEVAEKVAKIKASLEKKYATKSNGTRKPTKTQLQNEADKTAIYGAMVDGERYTITDMIKTFTVCTDMTNQKVSALVRQMVESHLVEKSTEKGKSYFTKFVADDEVQALDGEISF